MRSDNILVILNAEEKHLALLHNSAPLATITLRSAEELTIEQVESADIIVGNIPIKWLKHTNNVKLLQLNSSGVSPAYLSKAKAAQDMVMCCASGAYGPAISEHMLGTLLCLMKRLHEYRDQQRSASWIDCGEVRSPRGSNVLVIGMGDIGSHFAKLVSNFGASVIGIKRKPMKPPSGIEAITTLDLLDEILPWADVVAISLPETRDTIQLMNANRIALMRKGSYLLNVGRGSVVDQDALVEALRIGQLAGVALDVTVPEPLPVDHPLWQEKNAIITPHVSGGLHLPLTLDLIIEIAARNIRAFYEGGQYFSRVNPITGYRS